jgi:hypothetical protein
MRLTIFFLLLFLHAQGQLPPIQAETADNKTVSLPADLQGKYSLLAFASSMKAQDELETWLDPVYQKFIAKTGLMDDMYDVHVFFIPILTGTNVSFATSMKKKFRESAQADLQNHVLFCREDGKDILDLLKMHDRNVPYFILLDKEGNIIYRTSGRFSDEKFDAIDDLIE